jgi:exopolysaccharide biosynthesis polyprenyl glycosylphosphotransferase
VRGKDLFDVTPNVANERSRPRVVPDDPGELPEARDRVRRLAVPRPRPQAEGVGRQFLFDALMLVLASIVVIATASTASLPPVEPGWQLLFSALVLVSMAVGGAYKPRFTLRFLDDLRLIFGSAAVAAMATTFAQELFAEIPSAASQAVRAWLFAVAYLAAGRGGMQIALVRERRRNHSGEATLIIGAGQVGSIVAKRMLDAPEFGLRPVAFVDDDPLEGDRPQGIPVYGFGDADGGLVARVEELADSLAIRHVVVAFSLSGHGDQLELMRRGEELGISVSIIPRLFERLPDRTRVERLGGIPLITVYPSYPKGWQFTLKYAIDRLAALALLVLISPLLLVLSIGVLATLGRPILFRQPRVGVDGQSFDLLKFRSMRDAAARPDQADEGLLAGGVAPGGVEGEDRRTPLGKFMRGTSLDELPQLFNVLRGEMSLVGPRPERVAYARIFEQEIYRYAERHRVRSGITGWAQIHKLRGSTSLDDRVEWDNYYIENWSLWLDFKIMLQTPVVALRDRSE